MMNSRSWKKEIFIGIDDQSLWTRRPENMNFTNSNLCHKYEALTMFEELPSDNDSAVSNNSDTDDEDCVENVVQGENISSDDEEIDEIQCPSTSQPEV
ncbi:hypothetical protein TNCT_625131 [Trichonephila clavata]|uniref:Uncharacterized protein n=1 Tax=Trichonephila clavata TaxID=2740835 RepID=A0A8X6HIA9_TRICU|nr:hypothetical protein TNCT_625131 [Trichonephila clavata]